MRSLGELGCCPLGLCRADTAAGCGVSSCRERGKKGICCALCFVAGILILFPFMYYLASCCLSGTLALQAFLCLIHHSANVHPTLGKKGHIHCQCIVPFIGEFGDAEGEECQVICRLPVGVDGGIASIYFTLLLSEIHHVSSLL